MKTITPGLDPAVLERLRAYAAQFAPDFPQSKPARWAGVYLRGLLTDGERKSIEPLSRRVTLPENLTSHDPEQALQQFVSQSTWNEQAVLARYRTLMAEHFGSPEGVFVFDDTSFPKRGRSSVGVSHQYCGALGKRANCQVVVTLHYSSPSGHFPLGLRLHLPESWTDDDRRMHAAGVPEAFRVHRTKCQVALELLDQARAEGVAGCTVVADAGYGSAELRDGLAARGLHYVVGVSPEPVVFTRDPRWTRHPRPRSGRPSLLWWPAPDSPRPVTVGELAGLLQRELVVWRHGTGPRGNCLRPSHGSGCGRLGIGIAGSARGPSQCGCWSRSNRTKGSSSRCLTCPQARRCSWRCVGGSSGGESNRATNR